MNDAADEAKPDRARLELEKFAQGSWVCHDEVARAAFAAIGLSREHRSLRRIVRKLRDARTLEEISDAAEAITRVSAEMIEGHLEVARGMLERLPERLSAAVAAASATGELSPYDSFDLSDRRLEPLVKEINDSVETIEQAADLEDEDLRFDMELAIGGLLCAQKASGLRYTNQVPGYDGPAAHSVQAIAEYAVTIAGNPRLRSAMFSRLGLEALLTAMAYEARTEAPPARSKGRGAGSLLAVALALSAPFSFAWALHLAPASPWLAGALALPGFIGVGAVLESLKDQVRNSGPETAHKEIQRFLLNQRSTGLGAGTKTWLEYLLQRGVNVPPIAFDLCEIVVAREIRGK